VSALLPPSSTPPFFASHVAVIYVAVKFLARNKAYESRLKYQNNYDEWKAVILCLVNE
jgi:hypothetical protein